MFGDKIDLITGEASSADTKMSPKLTTTSVMFGTKSFRLQKKSLEGPDVPKNDRNWMLLPLKIAKSLAFEDALDNLTRISKGWRSKTFNDPFMLRTLMPLICTNLSGKTKSGGCLKSSVRHVSRSSDEKKRDGHGRQNFSRMSDL